MARTLRRSTTRDDVAQPVDDVHTEEPTEAPARGRRRTAADEKPSRRSRDEDDASARPVVSKGWDGFDKNRTESSDYAPSFKVDEEDCIIKFLDDEPFAVYRQHWIERSGKRSFNCLGTGCPLCDEVGDRPGNKIALNIVNLRDPDNPVVEVWTVSQKVGDIIKKFAKDAKTAPINKDGLYWSVGKTGKKGGAVQTNLRPVKERDLEEDWDVTPLTTAELDEFDAAAYDEESAVDYQTKRQLQEIADEILAA